MNLDRRMASTLRCTWRKDALRCAKNVVVGRGLRWDGFWRALSGTAITQLLDLNGNITATINSNVAANRIAVELPE